MYSLQFTLGLIAVTLFPSLDLVPLPGLWATAAEVPGRAERQGVRRQLDRRDDSPTDACFRWSQQSAVVNGSLYLYGGQATTSSSQTDNAWNNNFLVLDLTKTWPIGTPPLTGLPQPSGPPAVSNGYLWNSHQSLYLYGGEFSWKPAVSPVPFALWEYAISSQQWVEHGNPQTSSGSGAPSNGDPVQRAAEGAGVNVVGLGRGFYFGGHLDGYTTSGWSQSIARVYLQSLLEFTFPTFSNNQVDSLKNGQTADSDGAYRNITQGGQQASAGFTQRADGLLIYVPGFGDQGILLALAGGTNQTYTPLNEIDVYDIATSSWFVQATSGPSPPIRVDPCAVIAAAPDGSSYNIYMFGGQNIGPLGNQTEYNDMWILTLPSFTWIQVDQSDQSVPPGRSGHTCNVWDGQMVSVGGYTGGDLTCESPGIYVYDLSGLQWVQQFTALSAGTDSSSSSSKRDTVTSTGANNPFNQQPAQIYNSTSPGGLEGSYGYQVPAAVISVIGGGPTGGATVTAPQVVPTSGPLATGKAMTYSVTASAGASSTGGSDSSNGSGGGSGGGSAHRANVAAIAVGVVCGVLLIAVCYLAFCAYLYRRQLQLYKRHVAMTQLGTHPHGHGDKEAVMAGAGSEPWAAASHGRGTNGSGLFLTQTSGSRHNTSAGGGSGPSASQEFLPGASEQLDSARRSSDVGSVEDLLEGHEPTFVGVMLHPRRSLRVINRD